MDKDLERSAALSGRDKASIMQLVGTLANGTLGTYCQDDSPETAERATNELLNRVKNSATLEEIRADRTIGLSDLVRLLGAIVLAFATKLHRETLALPIELVDRISRGVATDELSRSSRVLREAAGLLSGPVAGVGFGEYLRDDAAAERVSRVAALYEVAEGYRRHRAEARRLHTSDSGGAPRAPETDLLVAVDEVLSGRPGPDRRRIGIALASEFLDTELGDEQVRSRLKDLERRRGR